MSLGGAPDRLDARVAPDDAGSPGRAPIETAELLTWLCPSLSAPAPTSPEPTAASPAAAAQVADLVERWARRVSVGGDQRRGVARVDIGEGRYAGAELIVSAEGTGHVAVELTLPEGPRDAALSERIQARLAQRGISAEVVVR